MEGGGERNLIREVQEWSKDKEWEWVEKEREGNEEKGQRQLEGKGEKGWRQQVGKGKEDRGRGIITTSKRQ